MAISKSMQRRIDAQLKIRARLEANGWTQAKIERAYGLTKGAVANALKEPNHAAEKAIAAALKTHPHLLWRERYFADGRRKEPQPVENYIRPPTREARRKAVATSQEAA